jgi:predicted nuclease of restriction endonuclease-like RecB superfamily
MFKDKLKLQSFFVHLQVKKHSSIILAGPSTAMPNSHTYGMQLASQFVLSVTVINASIVAADTVNSYKIRV